MMGLEQRRTVIIRGRGQRELDTLLPIFCSLVERTTPRKYEAFETIMIDELRKVVPGQTEKTIRNYFTEILGQLFANFYVESGEAQASPLSLKLNQDGDQPFFFKVLILRLQFPNPSSKRHKYDEEVHDNLGVRPLVLVLQVMRELEAHGIRVSFYELAYHILNSLEALRGLIAPQVIARRIIEYRHVKFPYPDFSGSFDRQHIKESLNLLYLANLIRSDSDSYWLNSHEKKSIDFICATPANQGLFRRRGEDESHFEFQNSWKRSWTSLASLNLGDLQTSSSSFRSDRPQILVHGRPRRRATDIGREGELTVIDLENSRLREEFPDSNYEAKDLAHIRGIGYDIESVFHDHSEMHAKKHYIEVKSTLRVTKPDLAARSIVESFVLTRSEKVAADTYGRSFSVYRLYIYVGGFSLIRINNLPGLQQKGLIKLQPDNWSAEYDPSQLLEHIELLEGGD
jgi:hypothetical protein